MHHTLVANTATINSSSCVLDAIISSSEKTVAVVMGHKLAAIDRLIVTLYIIATLPSNHAAVQPVLLAALTTVYAVVFCQGW